MDVIDNALNNPNAGLEVNSASKVYLAETAKWANFFAILGFIFLGLIVVMAIVFGFFMSSVTAEVIPIPGGGAFFALIYIIVAGLYYFPTMYLYKFAKHAKVAVKSDDTHQLQIALENQKSAYKFVGIMMIISLALYALVFLIGGGLALFMR